MCGICGVFGDVGGADPSITVGRMAKAMFRRGPDSQAVFPTPHGALGFARLAILDLSPAGDQPMATADGRLVLAFNGEIYNFKELRAELQAQGCRFTSSGDTEVVLQALAVWGEAALPRFNGMFALALCDVMSGEVLLARDRWGMKPLFMRGNAESLVFASQLDLVCAVGSQLAVRGSAVGLYQYFTLGFPIAPAGLLETVEQVSPGHFLRWRSGATSVQVPFVSPEWWCSQSPETPSTEELNVALEAAVRRHLTSDVPVGVLLSGGVDSPLVAATTSRISEASVPAFTIGVEGDGLNEADEAVRIAGILKLDHHVQSLSSADVLSLFEDVMQCSSHPVTDFSLFPTLAVFRLAAPHVKVLLTGDGADELMYGYVGRYRAVRDASPALGAGLTGRIVASLAARFSRRRRPVRDIWESTPLALMRRKLSTWSGDATVRLFPSLSRVHAAVRDGDRGAAGAGNVLEEMRKLDLLWHLPGILDKVDRASMYWSVEARVPFLDNDFAALALRFGADSCLDADGETGKIPLRRLLVATGVESPKLKRGFTVPMRRWLMSELREPFLDAMLSRRSLLDVPLRKGEVARLFAKAEGGDDRPVRALWGMFAIASWEDRVARLRLDQAN